MANTNNPFGFMAQPPMYGLLPFVVIGTSNTSAVYKGDIAAQVNDGSVTVISAGNTFLVGAVEGAKVKEITSYSKALLAASTDGTLICHWSPDQKYLVQGDVTSGSQTLVGRNADHVQGTGSAITGRSGGYLDLATTNTTTYGWRLVQYFEAPDNDITSTYPRCITMVNETFMKSTTGI